MQKRHNNLFDITSTSTRYLFFTDALSILPHISKPLKVPANCQTTPALSFLRRRTTLHHSPNFSIASDTPQPHQPAPLLIHIEIFTLPRHNQLVNRLSGPEREIVEIIQDLVKYIFDGILSP